MTCLNVHDHTAKRWGNQNIESALLALRTPAGVGVLCSHVKTTKTIYLYAGPMLEDQHRLPVRTVIRTRIQAHPTTTPFLGPKNEQAATSSLV
jgi:hypothetical protein